MTTCARCGAMFDGNYCPYCGTPAPRPTAVPPAMAAPAETPCARCGTPYKGNFCPRCGWPRSPIAYPPAMTPGYYGPTSPAPYSDGGRSVLSVIWTIALALFLILALLDFAALFLSPASVVPGVTGISSGRAANGDFATGNANWTFAPLSGGATGTYVAGGGPGGASDGYVDIHLSSGTNAEGMWYQPFRLTGSEPFAGRVSMDVQVQSSGSLEGELIVAVETSAGGIDPTNAVGIVWYNSTSAWSRTASFEIAGAVTTAGTYYLKIAFNAVTASAPVDVGIDNVDLHWGTDEFVVLYLPLPLPTLIAYTQDKATFLGYYGLVFAVILGAGLYYLIRERRLLVKSISAPLGNISARLRSMSGWLSVMQVWMAVTFAQFAIFFFLLLLGVPTPSPIPPPTPGNAWTLLFDLANAPMYEELVFRGLLIGVPMFVASLAMQIGRRQGGIVALRSAARYLIGGSLKSTSPREAHLAAWVLLFASSALFGVAHAPSWGSWKIVPAMIAGLGFGYLFLRHGIGAAILAHFVNDYAGSLLYENVGGAGLDLFTTFLLLGLALIGVGFFAWYVIYAWQHLEDLLARFGTHLFRQPVSTASPPIPPGPMPPTYLPPPPQVVPVPPMPPMYAARPAPTAAAAPAVRSPLGVPADYVPMYRPPPYGFPPVRFQCPTCGWVEARYLDGKFTCLRCGRTA